MKSSSVLVFLSGMFLISTLCIASADIQKTDFKEPITLDNAVKLAIANSPTYEAAKKNMLQSYSKYFKASSNLSTKESSENTLKAIIESLDKQFKTQGEKAAYESIKGLLVEDATLTYYQIMLYNAKTQMNLADQAYYNQVIEDSEKSANKSDKDSILSYKKSLETAESGLKENQVLANIFTEKLATLMGVYDSKTIADIKLAEFNPGVIRAKSKDYYLEAYSKHKADLELKEKFLLLYADSTIKPSSDTLIDSKYNELVVSIAKRDNLEKTLTELALQRNKIVEDFNAGKADITAINHAQNKLVNCELEYVNSVIEASKADSALNFVIGNSN